MIPTIAQGSTSIDIGRYLVTEDEIHERFVAHPDFSGSTTRAEIWDEWQRATQVLRSVIPIASVWVGGSFTTTKLDPSDIDCLYWLDAEHVEQAHLSGPAARNILEAFATPNRLKREFGLRIDSYVASWRSIPDPSTADAVDFQYYRDRGHWDDWWQRQRQTTGGAPVQRTDSIQRRGYLEVIFDGFAE